MSSTADNDIAISASAVRSILELPTPEILRVLVGLGQPNELENHLSADCSDRRAEKEAQHPTASQRAKRKAAG